MNGCRFSSLHQNLSISEFRSLTCAYCLFYIYFVTPPYSQNYVTGFCPSGLLVCPDVGALEEEKLAASTSELLYSNGSCSCDNRQSVFNLPEYALDSRDVNSIAELELYPPLPNDYLLIVGQCCEAASRCCQNTLLPDSIYATAAVDERRSSGITTSSRDSSSRVSTANSALEKPRKWCPATWDGWQCFERSPPGEEVSKKCPSYIFGDHLRHEIEGVNIVRKRCMENGEWFVVPKQSSASGEYTEWSDYSGCSASNAYSLKLVAGLLAFAITVVAIIPALVVFSIHRQLKNQSVYIIHRQLLCSFLFTGCFYIFNCLFFAVEGAVGEKLYFINHIACRFLFTVQLRYLRITTFFWMLAEGVYLYRLLMCTFRAGTSEYLRRYYIACWVYSYLRQTYDNEECWVMPAKYWWIEWTVIGPCVLALTTNLLLMMIIFCVLVKKLRFSPESDIYEPAQYRKAVRAVFLLVPIFGLHFLITVYRIQSYAHQILNLVLDGLQGFLVSMIVCYTNRTVIERIRVWVHQKRDERKLRRQSERHRVNFKRSSAGGSHTPTPHLKLDNRSSFNCDF